MPGGIVVNASDLQAVDAAGCRAQVL